MAFVIGAAPTPLQNVTGRSTRRNDKEKFLEVLAAWELQDSGSAEDCAQRVTDALARCMDASTPKKLTVVSTKRSVHWGSPGIAKLRTQSNRLRRTYQRKKKRQGPEACEEERNAARHAKLSLVNAIKAAKEAAWADLCALVDEDPWGKLYRL